MAFSIGNVRIFCIIEEIKNDKGVEDMLTRGRIIWVILCLLLVVPGLAQAANIVVTNANNSGSGSLRQAIITANWNVQPDTITFGPNLEDKTITLASELDGLSENGTTINGEGSPLINGSGIWGARGIKIYNVSQITVSGLRLVGFKYGIDMDWTVNDITISGNQVFANPDYTDDRVTIAYNARSGPGGPTARNITFSGNRVENGRFGIYVNEPSFQVQDVVIEGNTAIGYNSAISINTAHASGSSVSNVRIANNTVRDVPDHPGIIVITSHEGATTDNCSISNVTVSGNTLENTGSILARIDSGSNNSITGLVIERNKLVDGQGEGINLHNEASNSNTLQGIVRNNIVVGCAHEGIQCSGWVTAEVKNNLCGGNRDGLAFDGDCLVTAANNLCYKNNTGIKVVWPAAVQLVNNLIVENCLYGIRSSFAAAPVLSYNNVWNNGTDYSGLSPGAHDLSVPPLFGDPNAGDFHLQSGSPCIDAGNPASEYNDVIPPGQGTVRCDIGLYGGPGAAEFDHAIPSVSYYSGISWIWIGNTRLSPGLEGQWGGKFAFHLSLTTFPCTVSSAKAISPSNVEITLYDDGTHGDGGAGDGAYQNLQMLPSHPQTGEWRFVVETTGGASHYQSVNLDEKNTLLWPSLIAPAEGSTVSTLTPTLAWFPTPGANDGYRIGIFDGAPQSFSPEGLIFITEIGDPAVTLYDIPDGILKGGKTYYWFVQALAEHNQDNGGYANQSMEMSHFSTPDMSCYPGDFDGDSDVDGLDLATFAAAFGSMSGDVNYNPEADFDEDDDVDQADLATFTGDFGKTDGT